MTFYLLNANGGRISQGISLSYNKNRTGTFNQMLNAGTYYIEATAFAHNIPYTIVTSGTAPVINVSRVSGVKVSSPAKGRISIRWKTTSCTGYQVQISRSKYFLGRIYQRTYTTRYASYWGRKGMSRGKKYYVRVRAYTNAYGRTVYGSWSSVKSVKIRKR